MKAEVLVFGMCLLIMLLRRRLYLMIQETLVIISIICISKVCSLILYTKLRMTRRLTAIDIARIAALGVPYYSFSISWSRILPFGKGPVNELALQHYEDLIDTCIEYGVQPVVTLFHVSSTHTSSHP